MIPMQLLSQVVLQHLVTKIFGKPCSMIKTTFKGSEVEVRTTVSGDDLKIVVKKVRGQVSGNKTSGLQEKKIWTPGRDPGGGAVVKPKRIISPVKQ